MDEYEQEYESPFRLPPGEGKCTSPSDHAVYPYMHEQAGPESSRIWGKECPVHSLRIRDKNKNWREWARYRNLYATAAPGDEEALACYMESMLRYVTADYPPDAQPPGIPVTRTKTWYDTDGRPHSYQVPARKRPSNVMLVSWSLIAVVLIFCVLAIMI